MGLKEKALKKILIENNIIIPSTVRPKFTDSTLLGMFKDEIFRVYKRLGGIDEYYAFRGKWDIISSHCIIELDEQLHFNDYRLLTLKSTIYDKLNEFPFDVYQKYCIEFKSNCLNAGSYGRKWTNDSCERMFGKAGSEGDFSGNGSPRWKQRAFYDFVKDVSQLEIPVVRLSIYDNIDYKGEKFMIGSLLDNAMLSSKDAARGFKKLIDKRLGM